VINALTDDFHPCQLLADMQTYREHRGAIRGRTVCWLGDGNNMCNSYINAARLFDFELRVACPEGFEPRDDLLRDNRDRVSVLRDPRAAVKGADLLVTDVWASMGQEASSTGAGQGHGAFSAQPRRCSRTPQRTLCTCTACRRTAARKSAPSLWTPATR
jgi:ornithine carbamoyltransferase